MQNVNNNNNNDNDSIDVQPESFPLLDFQHCSPSGWSQLSSPSQVIHVFHRLGTWKYLTSFAAAHLIIVLAFGVFSTWSELLLCPRLLPPFFRIWLLLQSLNFVQSPRRKRPPGVISRAAKGAPDRGPEGGEVALPLERRHYHCPELEVLDRK